MDMSGIFARFVALIGAVALLWRRLQGSAPAPAWGSAPAIPEAKPQGAIPTLKMPTAQGWSDGQKPTAATGLKVNAFAKDLDHPRWIYVLPNGDVLIAESTQIAGPPRSVFHYAMQATMRRARALGVSANRITLLRDRDGDGVAEGRGIFMEGLSQPFGMALVGDTFYVGNTDGVVAFPYSAGADRITAEGRKLVAFKPAGHWTRSLLPSADGKKLYAGVGSLSNIAESGMEVEQGRAAIYELDLASGTSRIFASGLRNAVGLAWEPTTSVLWTVVNERDGLGDETPPDYLDLGARRRLSTDGPIATGDRRWTTACRRIRPWSRKAIQPDFTHSAGIPPSLGLCWMPSRHVAGAFPDGMVIGQHGSWNRSTLSGYAVVFVPFENGRPSGPPRDILPGFSRPTKSLLRTSSRRHARPRRLAAGG
jgi:glucose/arabinose dehydrogenase